MAIILLPIMLTALIRNLKFLAPFSTLANALMIIGILIVLYYATQDLPNVEERQYMAKLSQLPLFFGTTIYAFEGIGLVRFFFLLCYDTPKIFLTINLQRVNKKITT